MKSCVLLKESYQARRGLTFTTNIHTSLHLTTESHLYSDLWSISLCTPVSTPSSLFSYLPPLFFRFISLYLPPPLLSCSFPAQLFLLVSSVPSLLPSWISCRWSIWRGKERATTAWEKHRLSSGRSTRGGTCCSPNSRCRFPLLILVCKLLGRLSWQWIMHSNAKTMSQNSTIVHCSIGWSFDAPTTPSSHSHTRSL